MVIGGQSVDAADGQTFEVLDPSTGSVMATAPLGGKEDVDRAVDAARAAFDDPKGWSSWSASKRGRTLAKFSALVKANLEELARLESRNVGKPITGARGEALGASLVFEYYAGAANKVFGETIPVSKPGPRLHAARADRRGRPDRALELPDADGQLEARAGARRREHLHPQAGQLDAAERDPTRRARPRGGLPGRRRQRRDRAGRDGRSGDRRASRRSARSPSPGRRRPARRSCGWPRTT